MKADGSPSCSIRSRPSAVISDLVKELPLGTSSQTNDPQKSEPAFGWKMRSDESHEGRRNRDGLRTHRMTESDAVGNFLIQQGTSSLQRRYASWQLFSAPALPAELLEIGGGQGFSLQVADDEKGLPGDVYDLDEAFETIDVGHGFP